MNTRRGFLKMIGAAPLLGATDWTQILLDKRPSVKNLQSIANAFLAPRIARDMAFFVPSCDKLRVRVLPDPGSSGYIFKALWTYNGSKMARCGALATFEKRDVASIVDELAIIRQRITLSALNFMHEEGATVGYAE